MTPALMTTTAAAVELGVHANTLRNWEEKGLIRAARLPGSGFRRYSREEVERLRHAMFNHLTSTTSDDAIETPLPGETIHGDLE
jgi:excisionase family DNA binding protein